MKVVINGSIFFIQKNGGISRYLTNLFSALVKMKINIKIVAPIHKNVLLKNIKKGDKFSNYFSRFPNYFFLNQINNYLSKISINSYKPDIIHDSYYSEGLKNFKNIKKIVTIHDLIHEKFYSQYPINKKKEKQRIINITDHFICVSKSTRNDLIEYYDIKKKDTSVIYHGCDHFKNFTQEISYKNKYGNFILYVGSREKYKNFKILCDVFKKISPTKKINVVCFGGGHFKKKELPKFHKDMKFYQVNGSDKVLFNLYKNALCYISTSLYEGFGIPAIEAMSLNCPVICSNINVYKEVCGSAALYFEPSNHKQIKKIILKLLENKRLRNKMITLGLRKSKNYTWRKCANKTIEVYKKVLNN